jgi:hypothetical protein
MRWNGLWQALQIHREVMTAVQLGTDGHPITAGA